ISILSTVLIFAATDAFASDPRFINGQAALPCQLPILAHIQSFLLNCNYVLIHTSIVLIAPPYLASETHTLHFGTSIPNSAFSIPIEACVADPEWEILGPHHGVDLAYCTLRDTLPDIAVTPIPFGCERSLLDDPTTGYFGAGYGVSDVDD